MDELYRIHSSFSSSNGTGHIVEVVHGRGNNNNMEEVVNGLRAAVGHGHDESHQVNIIGSEMSDVLKAQIANHPFYPNLVSAYIQCRKVISFSFFYLFLFIFQLRFMFV